MIKIDGSQGEGGGQILRTSVSLSAITGRPVEVINIRAKRTRPGLRPQHLAAVRTLASLFDAKTENLQAGADWIRFTPSKRFLGGAARFDVGTAGSIPMIMMAVVPAVSLSGNQLQIELVGGTDVRASPTIDYIRYVVIGAYRSIGIKFSIEVLKRGYYPRGGGVVKVVIEPCNAPGTVQLLNGQSFEPKIVSVCGQLPKHVAERQISSALIALEKKGIRCSNYTASYEMSLSPGSSILVYSSSDYGQYIGGDSIGELGKRAEAVGLEAAERFLESTLARAPVDPFLADMIVLPLALARGRSRYRVPRLTRHLKTNLEVARQILRCRYQISKTPGEQNYFVEIEGGLEPAAI